MTTLHANYAIDAMHRLETMCMMSDINLPVGPLRAQIISAIDVVVQQSRLRDGKRRVVGDLVKLVLDLGSVPLAEGIEQEVEAQICREMGFQLIQGFLTGRPIPVENL